MKLPHILLHAFALLPTTSCQFDIHSPNSTSIVTKGSPFTIRWVQTDMTPLCGPFKLTLQLRKSSKLSNAVETITEDLPRNGTYTWTPNMTLRSNNDDELDYHFLITGKKWSTMSYMFRLRDPEPVASMIVGPSVVLAPASTPAASSGSVVPALDTASLGSSPKPPRGPSAGVIAGCVCGVVAILGGACVFVAWWRGWLRRVVKVGEEDGTCGRSELDSVGVKSQYVELEGCPGKVILIVAELAGSIPKVEMPEKGRYS